MSSRKPILFILSLITLVTLSMALWPHINHQPLAPSQTVTINDHRFAAVIADTPQKQLDGLSGWTHLGPDQGMYFPLNNRYTSFWMKGMLINIDIIWIEEGRVVGIDADVPAPQPNTPDEQLPSYPSPVSQPDAVFEVAAGRAQELGIEAGDTVEISF